MADATKFDSQSPPRGSILPSATAAAAMDPDGRSSNLKPHFVLVPLLAPGHMIPMVDMAILLAERGARVSLITTPVNAARTASAVGHRTGLLIDFVELLFPCAAAGLPDGCENVDLIPPTADYMHLFKCFFSAAALLRDPLKQYLQAQPPSPACMITDACNPWTRTVAEELRMTRLIFHGPSCFHSLCSLMVKQSKIWEQVKDPSESFDVPGLPHPLRLSLARLPWLFSTPGWEEFRDEVIAAEAAAGGAVINTFDDLERAYVETYRGTLGLGKKVWTIGPLSLAHRDSETKIARGNKVRDDEKNRVLRWLDGKPAGSVVYVSFGSLIRHEAAQLLEIGHGLEASGRAFVWVIKEAELSCAPELEKWVVSSEKGIVVRGWAPQAAILEHPAVGGFVTHCGWNSTTEAAAEGVPMATWPHFGDQFVNEKLVVDVLGIGVAVFAGGADGRERVVKREEIAEAVRRLMDEGAEGEERRERAREVGRKARAAMEAGGSSGANLTQLLDFVVHSANEKNIVGECTKKIKSLK